MQVWIDGKYYEKDDAKISVFDHGLLYGDGIFEGIRIYNGKIFKLAEHIRRLFKSAKAILLNIPMTPLELEKLLLEAVAKNEKKDGYIRLVVTRGKGDLGANPFLCSTASVIVIVGDIQLYPEKNYMEGISLITASVRRIGPSSFDVRVKSLNYLNNVLAKIEAAQAGCMEAVILNEQGFVAECTVDNIFIYSDGVLMTPESTDQSLEGITRNTVLDLALKTGIPARPARMTQYDLYNADECFITGTGAEIMPVTKIDGRIIGNGKPGPITDRLRKAFTEFVQNG